ncbi:hypothetical protein EDB92DRAFT_354380 [Lactarius akahatsu]|uniref:Uncharacterized protein n=1 Tax=Lactarius akahatsu TaxID=416441 RepID=A0AAD4Q9B5_9AGAM|nr:hypothetical protein EDB92DRAFT_354380 [Lactarius akahatsu]
MPSRLVSVCDSRLSDASQPHGGKFLSSDELLAFRQFFTRRADDAPLDARDFSTFPHLDQHSHDLVSLLCDDAASDLAEYGDSVQYHSSSHGHGDLRGTVGSPDSRSKQDPLSALSVTRVESERVAPDNALPLAEGDPSSISRARLPNVSSPTDAEYSHSEEMHDSLPDFLDLSPDIESPQPQQVTHEIPPLADVSRFLPGDESPVVVLEDAMAGPSGGRNPKRFRGDRADPVLAESPTSFTRHVPRRVQSAAELAYAPRIPTQALPARAAAAFRADVTSRRHARRGYDASTGPVAGYEGGHAYSRSAVEPSDLWRRDSYYNRRVQHLRNGDAQHLKRGALVSADANSARIPVPGKRFGRPTESDVGPPVSSSSRRPRASSAAASPTPSLSPLSRYRTLDDRAYHHPDVPRTPLFSDLDYDPSSWGPDDIVAQPQGSSPGRDSDTDDRLISSPETESTFPSPQSDSSQSSPRPARPRPRAPSRSGGDDSPPYPSRESSYARRPGGSSPDLPRGQSFYIGPPSASSLGIGLSTIDNGAFEAPRPAPTAPMPTPRTQEKSHPPVAWQRRKNSLRILTTGGADEEGGGINTVFRKPLRSLSLTRKASNSNGAAMPVPLDPRVVRTAPPVSFRWQIWSKVQRPSERAGTPAGHLRAAGKSEPDFKTSFIETEEKPQRRGLLFIRKKS